MNTTNPVFDLKTFTARGRQLLERLERYAPDGNPARFSFGDVPQADVEALRVLVSDAQRVLATQESAESGIARPGANLPGRQYPPPPLPDGPHPPNEFWWRGECRELQPVPWKLLTLLWQNRGRWVPIPAVLGEIWDGKASIAAMLRAKAKINELINDRAGLQPVVRKGNYLKLE